MRAQLHFQYAMMHYGSLQLEKDRMDHRRIDVTIVDGFSRSRLICRVSRHQDLTHFSGSKSGLMDGTVLSRRRTPPLHCSVISCRACTLVVPRRDLPIENTASSAVSWRSQFISQQQRPDKRESNLQSLVVFMQLMYMLITQDLCCGDKTV